MDSINFCESPAMGLARQSKKRLKCLMIILGVWLVWVAVVFIGLNSLVQVQKNKATDLMASLDEINPGIIAYQHLEKIQEKNKKSKCAARLLNTLIDSPVKGVAISALSLKDKWEIQGRASNQQAFAELKDFIDKTLDDTSWMSDESGFRVTGSMPC
jgi:hypothetical protein